MTLHMFIACRGITILVSFLEADYKNHRFVLDVNHLHSDMPYVSFDSLFYFVLEITEDVNIVTFFHCFYS